MPRVNFLFFFFELYVCCWSNSNLWWEALPKMLLSVRVWIWPETLFQLNRFSIGLLCKLVDLIFGMSHLSTIPCMHIWEPTKFVPRYDQTDCWVSSDLLNARHPNVCAHLSEQSSNLSAPPNHIGEYTKLPFMVFFLLWIQMNQKGLKQCWQKQADGHRFCRLVAVTSVVHRLFLHKFACKKYKLWHDFWLHHEYQLHDITFLYQSSTACSHNAPASAGAAVTRI